MKRALLSLLSSLSLDAAQADWVCDSNTSKMNNSDGTGVTVCGSGVGPKIDDAKARALHEAHMEFWRLCMISASCKGYPVSIIPQRTECEEKNKRTGSYTRFSCRRSFTFIIDRSARQCDEDGRDMFRGCPMNQMPFDGV